MTGPMASPVLTAIDLYWLPLGAGGNSVRVNGKSSKRQPRGSAAAIAATSTTQRCRSTCPGGDS